MKKIVIRAPIWKEPRSIGIADYKITQDLLIEISYKNKADERLYPEVYFITKDKAKKYPSQRVRNVKIRIIPIQDLEVYNGD